MGHSYWLTNRTPNNTFQHAAGPYLCKIQPAGPAHLSQMIWLNPKSIRPILLHQRLNPYQKISGRKGSKSKCIKSNSLFWQKATLDPPLIRFDTQKYFIPSYCTVQKYFCISSFLYIFSTFSMFLKQWMKLGSDIYLWAIIRHMFIAYFHQKIYFFFI